MVQVLPYVRGFGEELADGIGRGMSAGIDSYSQAKNRQRDQKVLGDLSNNANASPMDQIKAFSSLSKESQNTLTPLFDQLLKTQQAQKLQEQKQAGKEQERIAKIQQKEEEKIQENTEASEIVNDLLSELDKGKVGKFNLYNVLSSKGRESRAYFDELALGIEKRLATMVGKGTLSKERFKYLKQNLPSASDTDATNRGRLKALAKEFRVDAEAPKAKNSAFVPIISPSGKLVNIPEDQVESALAAGGKLG